MVVVRLVLVGVFVAAAAAKFRHRDLFRQAILDFGVPARFAGVLSRVVPVVESAVAIALVPAGTSRWGAAGALVLLASFLVASVANLARGRKPDCGCFGPRHSRPIGARTLVRNGVLLVLAAAVFVGGEDGSVTSVLERRHGGAALAAAAGLVLIGVLVLMGWVITNLVAQQGRLLARVEQLERSLDGARPASSLVSGDAAPDFTLRSASGTTVSLQGLRVRGRPVLLVFGDTDCPSCQELVPDFDRAGRDHADLVTVITILSGRSRPVEATDDGRRIVLVQEANEITRAYGVQGTPSAVLVNPDGRIASALVEGRDLVRGLLQAATLVGAATAGHQGGAPAPIGELVSSQSSTGKST